MRGPLWNALAVQVGDDHDHGIWKNAERISPKGFILWFLRERLGKMGDEEMIDDATQMTPMGW